MAKNTSCDAINLHLQVEIRQQLSHHRFAAPVAARWDGVRAVLGSER
ncbi:hypothetical protein [uncultured Methylobacterium sp.]